VPHKDHCVIRAPGQPPCLPASRKDRRNQAGPPTVITQACDNAPGASEAPSCAPVSFEVRPCIHSPCNFFKSCPYLGHAATTPCQHEP
jgi:hypothetical protein